MSRGKYPHNGRPAHYAFAHTCQMNSPGCPVSADFCEQKSTLSPMARSASPLKSAQLPGTTRPRLSALPGSQRLPGITILLSGTFALIFLDIDRQIRHIYPYNNILTFCPDILMILNGKTGKFACYPNYPVNLT